MGVPDSVEIDLNNVVGVEEFIKQRDNLYRSIRGLEDLGGDELHNAAAMVLNELKVLTSDLLGRIVSVIKEIHFQVNTSSVRTRQYYVRHPLELRLGSPPAEEFPQSTLAFQSIELMLHKVKLNLYLENICFPIYPKLIGCTSLTPEIKLIFARYMNNTFNEVIRKTVYVHFDYFNSLLLANPDGLKLYDVQNANAKYMESCKKLEGILKTQNIPSFEWKQPLISFMVNTLTNNLPPNNGGEF